MTWVTVPSNGGRCTVKWFDGGTRMCDPDGTLTIERWGIQDWEPRHSGFITLGDNNERADQGTGQVGGAVRMDWVEGKARAEIPWIGLIKLVVSPTENQANPPADWARFGNARAPSDLWVMLGVSLVALFVAPMIVEAGVGLAVQQYRARGDGPDPPPNPPDNPPEDDPDDPEGP
jgi:hypothetical protein